MSEENATSAKPMGGPIAWFSHNHAAANILMLLFLVGGLFAVSNMRTETFPSIDPRLITISTVYPGATPYDVADSITERVEEALVGINGVERITSTASEGYGLVRVELEDFANADDVYNDVDTAVSSLVQFPPEDAERPKIIKAKVTPNVMTLALHGNVPEKTLKFWAETIEDELRQMDGVAKTALRGIRDYEISIEVSESTLRQYGLTLQDIGDAINAFALDVPAGTVESSQGDILLRIQERRYIGEEFERIVVRTLPDGSKLRLGEIAKVVDGFEDINLISHYNGETAAFIDVSRNESDDTLQVASDVKNYLETVTLPTGLTLSLERDETIILKERMSLMMRNAILGFMLVFLILLLFIDLKLAFWTSAAIPVSFLGGLMLMFFFGFSLNMISLFALIVVLGIVVDDAIITGESIYEAQEEDRNDKHAVLKGVRNVIAPVTIGVLTTMAAFGPLVFSTGTLGQIIRVVPIVVMSILLVSLLEAYFILPAHLSKSTRWSKGILRTIRNKFSDALAFFVDRLLLPFARFTIEWRYATLAAFFALAVLTVGMVSSGIVRFIFFPQVEGDEITITATLPEGTPFATTQITMTKIEQAAEKVRHEIADDFGSDIFESTSLSIGQTSSGRGGPGGGGDATNANNIGQYKVTLVSSDQRDLSAREVEEKIRALTEDLPNIETLKFKSSLIGDNPDVEVELSHSEEDQLNKAAEDLKEAMNNLEGLREVEDSFEPGKTEYVFKLTDEGLATGLTPAALGQQLRYAYFGLEAQRFQRGRSEMVVYVRYPKEERESIATLAQTRIRLADGSEVPLSQVAEIKKQTGYSQIQSVNGRRVVSVTGNVDYETVTPNDMIAKLDSDVLPVLRQRYPGLSYSFEGESRDQRQDMASLGKNMLIALMIMYVLLGSLLRSYAQPLIIMSAIPFGVIGAIWGHFFLGHDLSFISMFGIVALSGVVVNDSVVLMDYFNNQRLSGHGVRESALMAVKRRFRPILLTSATTSLGLLPMLLETSRQAQFLIPMVVSLAAGILFATVVILFLIPNLLVIQEDIKRLFSRFFVRVKNGAAERI